jgi:AraC-like DNA-binding protein
MDLAAFDLMLRGATFGVAVAAAVAIVSRHRRGWSAPLAAFAIGGIAAFIVASLPGGVAKLGPAVFVFDAWCLATPFIVWMLAGTLFDDDFRPGAWHLAVGGAILIVTFAGDWGRYRLGPLADDPELAAAMFRAGRVLALMLLIAACGFAIARWRADLVELRRRARAVFVVAIGAVFAAFAASDFVLGPGGVPLEWLVVAHAALLAFAFGALQLAAHGFLDELWPIANARSIAPRLAVVLPGARLERRPHLLPTAARPDGAELGLARRVTAAMENDRLWQREGLSIAALARELGTQEHLLRRTINRRLGYRNFNDFLHDYRLAHIARRLADPADQHLPVLTIALDSGYGSIGPFNRAFKARFGVTPSQYRELRASESAEFEIGRISR